MLRTQVQTFHASIQKVTHIQEQNKFIIFTTSVQNFIPGYNILYPGTIFSAQAKKFIPGFAGENPATLDTKAIRAKKLQRT
jgi:hypothetical protein